MPLRGRKPAKSGCERILFPFVGTTLSRPTLDAALRLARAESATLVPAYIATIPMSRSLGAPITAESEIAMSLLEAIEQRASRAGVPVDSRIERGRNPRHGLEQLIEHEQFDRIVAPAATASNDGFTGEDIAWLLEHAPGEVVVMRPEPAEA